MAKKTNIDINGNKYFKVRLRVGYDKFGKPIDKQFYGLSQKEAEQKRNEYKAALDRGLFNDFDKIKFGDLYEEWLEQVKRPTIVQNTYIRYEGLFRLYIKPSKIFKMKLVDIRSIHVQKVINELPTPSTAERVHLLLSSFFKYCVEEQFILRSPTTSVKLPPIVHEDKKEFLEREEIEKLVKLDHTYFIFKFAAFTGMRQGEILALTHEDIDFDKGLIRVNKSVKRVTFIENGKRTSKTHVKEPKTKAGKRDIPIASQLVEPLKKQILAEKEKHLKHGAKYTKSALLFSTSRLTHMRGDHLLTTWKKIQPEISDDIINFHALRHTFCTMLCEQGIPLTVAAMLMGHSDIETVSKIYAHYMKDSPKKAIEALGSYYQVN